MLTKKKFDVAETFGCKEIPPGVLVEGYAERTDRVPPIDEHYIHNIDSLRVVLNWLNAKDVDGNDIKDGYFVFGPRGCGKTSGITQVAARLNIPVYEKTFDDKMAIGDLTGGMSAVEGTTFIDYGPLTKAMGIDGMPGVFLANEIDKAPSGLLTAMNEMTIGIDIRGREYFRPLPGFRFACTANTNMQGENMHVHRGSRIQDPSFLDRFWVRRERFLDPATELKIILEKTRGVAKEIIEKMIEVANEVRRLNNAEDINQAPLSTTISTRFLVRWADTLPRFRIVQTQGKNPLLFALDLAGLDASSKAEMEAVHEIVRNVFGEQLLARAAV